MAKLGPDDTLVGYWPVEIFTTLADYATQVQWGGEITNAQTFGRHTTTQMGSGRFQDEGFRKSSYFRHLEIVDHNNSLQSTQNLYTRGEQPKLYAVNNRFSDDWGSYFFYGGPRLSHLHREPPVHHCICLSFVLVLVSAFSFSFRFFVHIFVSMS